MHSAVHSGAQRTARMAMHRGGGREQSRGSLIAIAAVLTLGRLCVAFVSLCCALYRARTALSTRHSTR